MQQVHTNSIFHFIVFEWIFGNVGDIQTRLIDKFKVFYVTICTTRCLVSSASTFIFLFPFLFPGQAHSKTAGGITFEFPWDFLSLLRLFFLFTFTSLNFILLLILFSLLVRTAVQYLSEAFHDDFLLPILSIIFLLFRGPTAASESFLFCCTKGTTSGCGSSRLSLRSSWGGQICGTRYLHIYCIVKNVVAR